MCSQDGQRAVLGANGGPRADQGPRRGAYNIFIWSYSNKWCNLDIFSTFKVLLRRPANPIGFISEWLTRYNEEGEDEIWLIELIILIE